MFATLIIITRTNPTMRHILLILLLTLASLPVAAQNSVEVFARYECQRDEVIQGDSTVVNIVVYSNLPFQRVKCANQKVKIKGGNTRLLPRRGERQQQQVRTGRGVYYAILWDSYIVGSNRVETIKFPELKFEVELQEYETYHDPFDPFGFFSRPQRTGRIIEGNCKIPTFTLPVIERPKRSTQEAISSGSQVA